MTSLATRLGLRLGGAGFAIAFGGVLGLAAGVSPKLVVVGSIGVVLVALMLTNLTLGIAFFTIVSFFQVTPGGGALPLAKPLGLVLTFAWVVALARERGTIAVLWQDRPGLAALLSAFFGWVVLSLLWADDVASAQSSAVRLALSLVFLLVVYSGVRSERDLRTIAWAFVIGASLTTVYGFVAGLSLAGRFTGGMADPNFLAAALVTAAAIGGFLLAAGERGARRVVLLVCLVILASGLVATGSRGGLIALVITLVVGTALAGSFRSRAVAVVLVVIAVGVGFFVVFASASVKERATSISSSSSAGRTDAWQVALAMAKDHPIVGVGLDNYPVVQSRYINGTLNLTDIILFRRLHLEAHNTYLQLLAEVGVIGLGLFAALVFGPLRTALQIGGAARSRSLEALSRGYVVGMIGLLTSYFFLSGLYEKQLWLLLGVLAVIPRVVRRAEGGTGVGEAG